ncbi:MAG: phosphatase PAP2 family protein [Candidatus Diapherotrites archaeon]|uniref:Phosphatase PAP2 family protein n=1 Tax=Candidatus Iainarchaeum sp. TaxID=3101447 RepID=A0A8T4L2K3_9ARCH|nr:phosphatase PAP2 family protein [Candidatus Diapherotrites archaeon]
MALIEFNYAVLKLVQSFSSAPLDALMQIITFFGNPIFWILIAAFLYWRGRENESFYFMNLLAFSAAVVGILKPLFGIARPDKHIFRVISSDWGFSFPSGHSTLIASVCTYAGRFARSKTTITLLAVLALAVAFSRMYLGVHFLTDVIAGLIIGFVIGESNFFMRRKLEHSSYQLTKLGDELAFVAVIFLGLVIALFFAVPALSGALIGFYAGFFLLKEKQFGGQLRRTSNSALKLAVGYAVVALLALPYFMKFELSWAAEFALFLIAGFWVSFILPYLWDRFCRFV